MASTSAVAKSQVGHCKITIVELEKTLLVVSLKVNFWTSGPSLALKSPRTARMLCAGTLDSTERKSAIVKMSCQKYLKIKLLTNHGIKHKIPLDVHLQKNFYMLKFYQI